jgi:nicotinamide phosphoribosyltransferase
MGTDTITSLLYARKYYSANMAGFSIPAMEHSTVTSWGRAGEVDSYRNMLKLHGKAGAPIAFVSDSYNIYEACKMWGTDLKQDVLDSGAVVVIRPDSGEPSEVVTKCLYILEKYFGSVKNDKGFRVLNNVRVIQGDGINHASIRSILFVMELNGFSADNVAFGQGGALLQQVNRDTMRFAMKCSSITMADGTSRDVYKDPITDSGKASKKGRVTLWTSGGEYLSAVDQPQQWTDHGTLGWKPVLVEVFRDGNIMKEYTFDEVRANARK